MSFIPQSPRGLPAWLACVLLLPGCQSIPDTNASVSSQSSVLAVEVRFPSPLLRDHALVQAFFVRGPIDAEALPELIPATFVKDSRAYLLDPAPGSYSLVAVSSNVSPARRRHPIAGGVEGAVANEPLGHVSVFPAELIRQTTTPTRSGEVAFMGALQVRRSERINGNAALQDDLQQRIAERIRPGVASRSRITGWLSTTWMVDLDATTLRNDVADRRSFFDGAKTDLGDSPWTQVITRTVPRAPMAATAKTHTPAPAGTAPTSNSRASKPESADHDANRATPDPIESTPDPIVSPHDPIESTPDLIESPPDLIESPPDLIESPPDLIESPPDPERQVIAGIPPDSPLAQIELGMHHAKVRRILGDPDDRIDRLTAQAWIPFNNGPGARLIEWIYNGVGRVIFTVDTGTLLVHDVVSDPDEPK